MAGVSRIAILFYIAAATTVIPGILHLNMGISQAMHSFQTPAGQLAGGVGAAATGNATSSAAQQPQERVRQPTGVLSMTWIFFIVAGVLQIFWGVPMARRWGRPWYFAGIAGTAALIALWIVTRIPENPITGRGAPASFGIYDEIFQVAYIAITAGILIYTSRMKRLDRKTTAESV
ncbi:MAG: hypothetical protein ABI361_03390 [Nitrososphaera sp.]|jgi:hypothetical protein